VAELAELTVEIETSDPGIQCDGGAALIARALDGEMLDPVLLTLRASHRTLKQLWECTATRSLVAEVIIRTGDQHLAAAVGVEVGKRYERLHQLTPRELEVLGLLSRGMSNREIARALVVEESTVKAHLHHLFSKLGAKSRIQAILIAQADGLRMDGSGGRDLD
jgi:DNA-binding NarL/FixJ family response regulator